MTQSDGGVARGRQHPKAARPQLQQQGTGAGDVACVDDGGVFGSALGGAQHRRGDGGCEAGAQTKGHTEVGTHAQDGAEVVGVFDVFEEHDSRAIARTQARRPGDNVVDGAFFAFTREKQHTVVVHSLCDLVKVGVGLDVVGELVVGAPAEHVLEARQGLLGHIHAANVVGAAQKEGATSIFTGDLVLGSVARSWVTGARERCGRRGQRGPRGQRGTITHRFVVTRVPCDVKGRSLLCTRAAQQRSRPPQLACAAPGLPTSLLMMVADGSSTLTNSMPRPLSVMRTTRPSPSMRVPPAARVN